jgi:hypothetical protein
MCELYFNVYVGHKLCKDTSYKWTFRISFEKAKYRGTHL